MQICTTSIAILLNVSFTRTAIQFYIIQETQHMDGYEFEYQCAKILKRKHFSKIKVTQSSGDQGIDIIAFKHRKKYGIQCKYYTHPVGNKAVQEAYAGANFYDCDKAVVMTNITFTKSATQLAQKLDVELWPNCPVTPCLLYTSPSPRDA